MAPGAGNKKIIKTIGYKSLGQLWDNYLSLQEEQYSPLAILPTSEL